MNSLSNPSVQTQFEVIRDVSQIKGSVIRDKWIDEHNKRNNTNLLVLDSNQILYFGDDSIRRVEARELSKIAGVNLGRVHRIQKIERSVYNILTASNESAADLDAADNLDDDVVEEGALEKLLTGIIQQAVNSNASDIHIQTDEDAKSVTLKFRVDSLLVDQPALASQLSVSTAISLGRNILDWSSKSKGGSSAEQFSENERRDASFIKKFDGRTYKCRYSHAPSDMPRGLYIVIRLRDDTPSTKAVSFSDLRYTKGQEFLLKTGFAFPFGLVLFTGPTGSGKSTVMAAGVSTLPNYENTLSFEDPVEARMANSVQFQVKPQSAKSNWVACAKSTLRLDPDNIIYGEMREKEIVVEGIQQAATGHRVLSTLHANSAIGAVQRLVDMGISWKRLADPGLLRMIVAQRLVRKLCGTCSVALSEAQPPANTELARLQDFFKSVYPDRYAGIRTKATSAEVVCPECGGAGEVGRRQVVEIIILDNAGRQYIAHGDLVGWEEHLVSQGWESMQVDALNKIFDGEFCPLSAQAVLDTPFGIDRNCFAYPSLTSRSLTSSQTDIAIPSIVEPAI